MTRLSLGEIMNSLVTLQITGKNVKRFVQSLYKRGIRFYDLEEGVSSVVVTVSFSDYQKIQEIPTIYEIRVLKYQGWIHVKRLLYRYRIFLLSLFLGIFLLSFLCHVIFQVQIVHDQKEMRDFLAEELKKRGIQKYHFIKTFEEKEKIEADLLTKFRDKLEWLEIERIGTKYIVRVEERKVLEEKEENIPRDLIAKKKGVILSIQASQGEVVKKVHDYVEAGDVLVSGVIKNKDTIKDYVAAKGQVFAETWYQVQVEIPYFHHETTKTGKKGKALSFQFLSKNWKFFSSFRKTQDKILFSLSNPLLPFSFSYLLEEEVVEEDSLYSYDAALLKAREVALQKLMDSLGKEDEIIYEKNLKNYEEDSKIVVEMFFKVKEDITSYIATSKQEESEKFDEAR